MSEFPFTAACVQVNAGDDISANVEAAVRLIGEAADAGADFVALPENVALMPAGAAEAKAKAADEARHPALAPLQQAARDGAVWLLVGSIAALAVDGRLSNRSLMIDPDGGVAARYDKIHLFDADPGGERPYRESETYAPGGEAVVVGLPWLKLGMTVCYDVRFPHLYRALANAGAGMLAVPSSFTARTGRAHWHVLLRARAIETGCFVIAPAQCGSHPGGRQTFGHSMIVDPWGKVLAEAGDEPGIVSADIDPGLVVQARGRIPALDHDRGFSAPV